ncbi:MAG: hypothetical protein MGU50_24905 [Trichodesmium sp. MAG_R02]|jgi:hypothetical protein|nr:hypothetical protein [Trichodesmium sp. MAG_R02]
MSLANTSFGAIFGVKNLKFQLIKAEGEAIHKSLAVKTEEINKAIADFPLTISHPIRDVKNSSEKPYSWLIKERKSNKAGDL